MHTHPTEGEPQYVARPVIDGLFPPGSPSRIPIVAVTGTNGKTTTVRMIAHILKLKGKRVGMTSTDGIVIDGRMIKKGDMSGPKSAQMVLQNPTVDTAVFEVARGGILREGLGYDRNDVAVVTNVTGDHLGIGGIDSIGQLANVKGVIVEAVPRSGTAVLNADDGHVYRMARHCAGKVVLFSMSSHKGEDGYDRVDGHTARGNAAFVLKSGPEGELIVLRHGPRTMPVLYTHLIPATFGGKARMNVANALAAAAAAWAAGAHLHDIRQGLRTFSTSFFQAPGRLNLLDVGGIRVVIDYCHNVDGMRQLADFVERMMTEPQSQGGPDRAELQRSHPERPGDRRDRDPGRPARRGPARVRRDRGPGLRRDHRSRGQESARARAGRVGRQRDRGGPGVADRRRPGAQGRQDARRADRGAGGAPAGGAGRSRRVLRRRRDRRLPRGDGRGRLEPGHDRVRRPGRARGAGGLMSRLSRLDVDAYRDWLAEEFFSGVVHVAGDDDEAPVTIALGLADRVAGVAIHPGTRFGSRPRRRCSPAWRSPGSSIAASSATRIATSTSSGLELRPRDLDPRVTLEHLLSHTSGVGDYADEYDGPPFEAIWETTPPATIRGPRDTLRLMLDLPRTGDPGEAARYNNGAYILLGVAIEEVTGRSFPDVVGERGVRAARDGRERLLAARWARTGSCGRLHAARRGRSAGSPATAWRTNVYSMPALGGPDGGAQSTAADLVRALDGLIGRAPDGAAFLTDATRARMSTVVAVSPEEQVGYGLGAIRVGEGPAARIGHAGEDPGFSCRGWAYDTGERVVVLSNVTEGSWQPFERLDELLTAAAQVDIGRPAEYRATCE